MWRWLLPFPLCRKKTRRWRTEISGAAALLPFPSCKKKKCRRQTEEFLALLRYFRFRYAEKKRQRRTEEFLALLRYFRSWAFPHGQRAHRLVRCLVGDESPRDTARHPAHGIVGRVLTTALNKAGTFAHHTHTQITHTALSIKERARKQRHGEARSS